MKKKALPIILLIGILVMNTAILCESLCLAGPHQSSHSQHKMSHTKSETSETQACPKSAADSHHGHADSGASIKCACAPDDASLSDVHLISIAALDLMPHPYLTASVISYKSSFMTVEPIPLESPPEISA